MSWPHSGPGAVLTSCRWLALVSLTVLSAQVASGQVAQMTYHLNRAMDNGLTQPEAAEVLSHLTYYVGWPNVFSALPVAKDVFEKRPR